MAWEVRERGDKLFDPCGEPVDLVDADVDLVEEQLGEIGVVVIETAVERLDQRCSLCVETTPGKVGENLRVALAGDERFRSSPAPTLRAGPWPPTTT